MRFKIANFVIFSFVLTVSQITVLAKDTEDDQPQPEVHKQIVVRPFQQFFSFFVQNFSGNLISFKPEDVTFYLYAKPSNPDSKKIIDANDESSPEEVNYNDEKGLILLIHSFEFSPDSDFPRLAKNEYLKRKEYSQKYNIVVVNWAKLANAKDEQNRIAVLSVAGVCAHVVGEQTAKFLLLLLKKKLLKSLDEVHVIGFGLGAQIGSMAVMQAQAANKNAGKLRRLTALDPASSFFTLVANADLEINKKHSTFVDVYHTDKGRIGMSEPIGHVDFYPNGGGPRHPGCNSTYEKQMKSENIPGILVGRCAHYKAFEYFILSMNSLEMKGCQCKSLLDKECMEKCETSAIYGQNCSPTSAPGVYFIKIGPEDEEAPDA